MLPVELSRHADERQAELCLRVDGDLFWFQGHFPGYPLLPGMAQLDWVLLYGGELLAPGWQFSAVESIKFQRPILPGSTLRLKLAWQVERCLLTFSYTILHKDGEQVASSGKISLCQ
ncbi:hydroxymyristoyl-ACP dehydratase [Sodalis sp. dw_96]|uniref:3-hydroxyacyl-ACP dehydratase FabZ family protein n=1 Tax=Sodalis sp. dw_96 TaxID=2719794 RepID=UPI001BD55DC8|nr:hydroxymyristoyl-ACP dehydratase [Sodalis sp. dw_96]